MKKIILLLVSGIFCGTVVLAENAVIYNSAASDANKSIHFIENKGQIADRDGNTRPEIKFSAQGNGVKLFFSADGIFYQFEKSNQINLSGLKSDRTKKDTKDISTSDLFRLDMKLIDANINSIIRKEEKNEYYENFYLAHCPQGITGVQSCSKIVYENIYPKIDWVIYSKGNTLEYDFVVHPGGNPKSIKINYNYANEIFLEKNGSVKIITKLGDVAEAAPVCFIDETKMNVESKFLLNKNTLQFEIGNYDATKTLVIDPLLLWSTYYGGSSFERAYGVSTDTSGNVFIAGETSSTGGIATIGGFQSSKSAFSDGFISKFDANGTRLWATYFGGSEDDIVFTNTTDKSGNIFIAGYTAGSSGLSSSGAQANYGGGVYDAFFAKFSSTGARLWSSYYGGTDYDIAYGCATDNNGNFYLVGTSKSFTNIAAGNGTLAINYGSYTAFLAKFTPNGSRIWGTYFGDGGDEDGYGCAVDNLGNAYLAGSAIGSLFSGIGGFQNNPQGTFDAILVKFDSGGSVIWSTYYGNVDSDIGLACATDNANNIYLAGMTNSSSAIASGGFQNNFGGGTFDGYLVKFDALGARLWGTYLGKTGEDKIHSCKTDSYGNSVVCGITESTTGISSQGFQNTYGGGGSDAFAASFSSSGARLFGSYIGGSGGEKSNACAIDLNNNIFLVGETSSQNFTTTVTAHQANYGGGNLDAFVAKIENPCAGSSSAISYSGEAYACAGNTLTLQAATGVGFNYQWLLNGTIISGATNVNYIASHGGNYVVVVNQNGVCQDSSAVLFVDSIPPMVPLCICTVDSLSKFNLLVWEKPASSIIDSFRIYREDITNVFSYVKSVGYHQLSLFIDSNLLYANPNVTSKLYKISSVDVCGVESALSPFHHTIKLNDQQNGNFDWNFYAIQGQSTPVLQYLLLRDSISSGIWTTIAITSGNVNQISDPDYNLYPGASYRIVTNLGSLSCTPTMRTTSGFSKTRSNIKNKSVGIKETENPFSQIILSPNPANNLLNIKNESTQKISSIRILDNLGRLIVTLDADKLKSAIVTIDISKLAPALYSIILESANFVTVKKLIKN